MEIVWWLIGAFVMYLVFFGGDEHVTNGIRRFYQSLVGDFRDPYEKGQQTLEELAKVRPVLEILPKELHQNVDQLRAVEREWDRQHLTAAEFEKKYPEPSHNKHVMGSDLHKLLHDAIIEDQEEQIIELKRALDKANSSEVKQLREKVAQLEHEKQQLRMQLAEIDRVEHGFSPTFSGKRSYTIDFPRAMTQGEFLEMIRKASLDLAHAAIVPEDMIVIPSMKIAVPKTPEFRDKFDLPISPYEQAEFLKKADFTPAILT